MTGTADRYRSLAADLTRRVAAVPPDGWERPSPCAGWTARDVVRHVTGTCDRFLSVVGRQVPPGPDVDADPAAAWSRGRDAVQAALDDPEVAGTEFQGAFGPSTFERMVAQFGFLDLLAHTWDLARATGLDERLDPDEVHALFEAALPMDEAMRRPDVCGPKVPPPPGADEQTRFLCFLGRRV